MPTDFSDAVYSKAFYEEHVTRASVEAAKEVVAALDAALNRPSTVIDVGCGPGVMLSAWSNRGAVATGIDAPWLLERFPFEEWGLPREVISFHDLREPIRIHGEVDLATCLETAEHLPPERGPGLVEDLCRMAPTVAFSAAIEGQGGTGHIAERPMSYWHEEFRRQGYVLDWGATDSVRSRLRERLKSHPWYTRVSIYRRNGGVPGRP